MAGGFLDAIGLGEYWPPFSRQYAYVGKTIVDVAQSFMKEVRDGSFVNSVVRIGAARKE